MFRLKRIISLFSLALNLHPPLQTCSETTHCCGSLIIYFLNLNLGKVHIKNSCEILFPVYNLRSETVPSHRWWSVYTRSKDYGNTPVQQVAVTQKTEQQKWAGTSDACRRGHARLKAKHTDYKLGTSQSYLKVSENVTKYQKFQFKLITKKTQKQLSKQQTAGLLKQPGWRARACHVFKTQKLFWDLDELEPRVRQEETHRQWHFRASGDSS